MVEPEACNLPHRTGIAFARGMSAVEPVTVNGRDIETMSREELIEAFKTLAPQAEECRRLAVDLERQLREIAEDGQRKAQAATSLEAGASGETRWHSLKGQSEQVTIDKHAAIFCVTGVKNSHLIPSAAGAMPTRVTIHVHGGGGGFANVEDIRRAAEAERALARALNGM